MEMENKTQNDTIDIIKKGLCIALAIIVLFGSGFFVGSLRNFNIKVNVSSDVQQIVATNPPVTNATVTTAPAVAAPPADNTATAPTSDPSTGSAPTSKEEIVALYNEAANKVKTEATKVTRNFKNTRYDKDQSVLPSALNSMASPMIEKYVTDDTTPVEYLTKEEIIENFPAPKQEYSSVLTANDVTDATCTDNGTEYEITLNLAPCVNPSYGSGVGAACHIMETGAMTSNETVAKMIKKFDTTYEGCVIKCKIDKATKRVTWANYYTPFKIDAVVNVVLSDVDAVFVMSYERDYTVTY